MRKRSDLLFVMGRNWEAEGRHGVEDGEIAGFQSRRETVFGRQVAGLFCSDELPYLFDVCGLAGAAIGIERSDLLCGWRWPVGCTFGGESKYKRGVVIRLHLRASTEARGVVLACGLPQSD